MGATFTNFQLPRPGRELDIIDENHAQVIVNPPMKMVSRIGSVIDISSKIACDASGRKDVGTESRGLFIRFRSHVKQLLIMQPGTITIYAQPQDT